MQFICAEHCMFRYLLSWLYCAVSSKCKVRFIATHNISDLDVIFWRLPVLWMEPLCPVAAVQRSQKVVLKGVCIAICLFLAMRWCNVYRVRELRKWNEVNNDRHCYERNFWLALSSLKVSGFRFFFAVSTIILHLVLSTIKLWIQD